jgi:ribosomal protein L20A (L18A)
LKSTIQRKSDQIITWRNKYKSLSNEAQTIKKLQAKLDQANSSLRKIKEAKKKQTDRHRAKLQNIKLEHIYEKSELEVKSQQLEENKNTEIASIENSMEQLKLKDTKSVIFTKCDGKSFKPEIREASYMLQNLGLSQNNASIAIKSLFNIISDIEVAGPLPSYTSQNNFSKEMKAVSQRQVYDMLKDEKATTLKFDGTTKRSGHLVEVEIATPNSTLLIGLKEQSGAGAIDYAKTIQKCVGDIEDLHDSDLPVCLLNNVSNTMTDRCPTNTAIENILDSDRDTTLNRFR